jgi:hypothetical protein
MSSPTTHAVQDISILRRIWSAHGIFDSDDDPLDQSIRGGKLARLFGAELPLRAPRRAERIEVARIACQTVADLSHHLHGLLFDREHDELPWGDRDEDDEPTDDERKGDELIDALQEALNAFPQRCSAVLPLEMPVWISEDIRTPTCICTRECCKAHAGKRMVFLFGCHLSAHAGINGCGRVVRQSPVASQRAPTLDAADEVIDLIAAMTDAAPTLVKR